MELKPEKYTVNWHNFSAEGKPMEGSEELGYFKADPSTEVGSGKSLTVVMSDSREFELEAVCIKMLNGSDFITVTMTTTLSHIAGQNKDVGGVRPIKLIGFVNVDEDLWVKQEWLILPDDG